MVNSQQSKIMGCAMKFKGLRCAGHDKKTQASDIIPLNTKQK